MSVVFFNFKQLWTIDEMMIDNNWQILNSHRYHISDIRQRVTDTKCIIQCDRILKLIENKSDAITFFVTFRDISFLINFFLCLFELILDKVTSVNKPVD